MPTFPTLVTVADCVAADTNTFLAGYSLTTSSVNLPQANLAELQLPKIQVTPAGLGLESITRDDANPTYTIGISVEQLIEAAPVEGALTVNQLTNLAEAIARWWVDTKEMLTAYDGTDGGVSVCCIDGQLVNQEPFDTNLLRNNNLFRALITLTFKC